MPKSTESVSIKVNKSRHLPSLKNVLNLNDWKKNKQKKSVWPIVILLFIIFAQASLLIYLNFKNRPSAYLGLIPPGSAATIYLDHQKLLSLTANLKQRQQPLFEAVSQGVKNLVGQNKLSSTTSFLESLDDQSVLVINNQLPAAKTGELPPPFSWLFLAKKRPNVNFEKLIAQTQESLKSNYNFTSSQYRQIEVVQLNSFGSNSWQIFFAQPQNFIFLANNQELIRQTIDKLLD